jgi:hypothetical protein
MDKQAYVAQMQEDFRRIMERVADAINAAPAGSVISGSEMEVRDLMAEFRQIAFQRGIQMRIDSNEATFSPSEGRVGPSVDQQGSQQSQRGDGQRSDPLFASSLGSQTPRGKACRSGGKSRRK